jgi:hypothetical protein
MSTHGSIGSCCARPEFNAVGGVDDREWTGQLFDRRRGNRLAGLNRVTVSLAALLAALAIAYVCARLLLAV